MVKHANRQLPDKASGKSRRKTAPKVNAQEEKILRAATIHLIRKHGMFLVATAVRKIRLKTLPLWVITVTLRYTTGQEGYLGDLLYDGNDFTFPTEQSVMDERTKLIANDPERQRKWNELGTAPLPAKQG